MKKISIIILGALIMLAGCGNKKAASTQSTAPSDKQIPVFNRDSAYAYVKAQVDFGPRVPGTEQHQKCADYIVSVLKQTGAKVIVQNGKATLYNGTPMTLENIIASFNPNKSKRIMLCAHWDTRPFADHDPNPANYHTPILGANDGASGVGVLLEIAQKIGKQLPDVGVDLMFFDLEDWGTPEFSDKPEDDNSWALGTQYWTHQPHEPGYKAYYGILLDMVGAPSATFYREQFSDYYAKFAVDKVWNTAKNLGFGNYFIDKTGGAITDDHVFVNRIAGIPCIDIIQLQPNGKTGFAPYWHTLDDNMKNIDKNTLYVVGQTLLQVIYSE